jgi:hypothetical protein
MQDDYRSYVAYPVVADDGFIPLDDLASQLRHQIDWGSDVICDSHCGTPFYPVSIDDYVHAYIHWRYHGRYTGCSHGW